MEKKFVDEKELTELLPISLSTLRQWRSGGHGPDFIKLPGGHRGKVIYDVDVVTEWLSSYTVKPGQHRYLKASQRRK